MIIDWHAHVYPPELAKERRWGGASPLTIENLLEAHENAGIERCVVSNTIHYLKDKTAEESLAFLRRWNEYGADDQDDEQTEAHEGRKHKACNQDQQSNANHANDEQHLFSSVGNPPDT